MRWIVAAIIMAMGSAAWAGDACEPVGEPVLERATMRSLGVYWIIRGDDNHNATISLEYRPVGAGHWHATLPLFRVEKGAHRMEKFGSTLELPDDAWLFAGSAVLLTLGTEYELRLKLSDADGGSAEKLLKQRTRQEPAFNPAQWKQVIPGNGGGSGTAADPFKGLAAAQASARPGDGFLLMPGIYEGTFEVKKSGEEGRPIIWRGSSAGEVILDAQGKAPKRPGQGIAASGSHDVWFENLSIINANWAIVAHEAARIVVRRCHIHQCDFGFASTRDPKRVCNDFFISDNLIEGPCTWPRTKGIEDPRGIQITGSGHEVCYNRIRGFSDAIDTFPSPRCSAIDFHNNEISECTDDGCEMDYSERNTRCYENRFTNVFQGISVQPVYGGPTYIFRNAIYNIGMEPFKMHNSPSGVLIFHNTTVKDGEPLLGYTSEKVRNCVYRNNLFVGTKGNYAYECDSPMAGCDFDYDGFVGGPWGNFLKWNKQRYATVEEAHRKAPVYRHAVAIASAKGLFASGAMPPGDVKKQYGAMDLRLAGSSGAVDQGVALPGFDDGFKGKAPDLGAYEAGEEMPWYGPREARRR